MERDTTVFCFQGEGNICFVGQNNLWVKWYQDENSVFVDHTRPFVSSLGRKRTWVADSKDSQNCMLFLECIVWEESDQFRS